MKRQNFWEGRMPDPYITAGLVHAAVAVLIMRKFVIYYRRKDEGEMAIPIFISALVGIPVLIILWPGVWVVAALAWATGLITIPEAISTFRKLRKELG